VHQRLGRDFTIQSLRDQGYKAIFLGIGLPKGRKLDLPARISRAFTTAWIFCAHSMRGTRSRGRKIIVIGGGNVAYDVARSAVRPQDEFEPTEAAGDVHTGDATALDVARSAVRMSGHREVHVVCLEAEANARRRS